MRPKELVAGAAKFFTAPTSMRDVEPVVHLWLVQPGAKRS